MSLENVWLTYAFLYGLAIGSFLNVCIIRIPQNQSLLGRSKCPHCKKTIRWTENIPVLSFLWLKGKCLGCSRSLSYQYPLIEIFTALMSILTFLHYQYDFYHYLIAFTFFVAPLICLSVIDFREQILPDKITIPGIFVGIIYSVYSSWPNYQAALTNSLLGILIGGGSLLLIAWLYTVIRKREGLGGGDIKLVAMLGAFLGWKALPFIFLIGSVSALFFAILLSIFQKKSSQTIFIPFGPFLSLSALLTYFYGEKILFFYMGL